MLTGWVPAPRSLCVPVVVDGITLWYQLSGDFVCVSGLIVGGLCNIPDRLFLVIVFIIATTITSPPTPLSPPVPDLYEGTIVGAQKGRTGETCKKRMIFGVIINITLIYVILQTFWLQLLYFW